MPRRFRFSLWLVAMMSFACSALAGTVVRLDPDPAWRKAESLIELTQILDTWLDENSALPRLGQAPDITFISPAAAASRTGLSGLSCERTRGLFDPEASRIFLVQPWNPKNAHDVSVLLHELVHARQIERHYYCPGAQEDAAYHLQDAWLRQRGLKADVNWIAVVLEAGCTPRNIHPD